MSKIEQPKIYVNIDPDLEEFLNILKDGSSWELVRERDGLTKRSKDVKWIQYDLNGSYDSHHNKAEIGMSLLMSPFNHGFTWQTSAITEIIESGEDYVQFKTLNSNYKLSKINKND